MDTHKQAGLWDSVKRLWRKWTGGEEYSGPTSTEDQVLDGFVEDLVEKGIWPLSPVILRKFVEEANKAGVPSEYMPYVFWLWNDKRTSWPQMAPRSVLALKIARDIVASQGDMPNYLAYMSMPPPEMEPAVDQVLERLGFWASGGMLGQIVRVFSATLTKWTPAMERAVGDTLPLGKSMVYLTVLFKDSLRRSSAQFVDGTILDDIFLGLLK